MKIWDKEIIFNKYTRGIDREYNEILKSWLAMKQYKTMINWVLTEVQEIMTWNTEDRANDLLLLRITNLSKEEIDSLSIEEYDLLFTEINKITKKVPTKA